MFADDGGENGWKLENGVCTECEMKTKYELGNWTWIKNERKFCAKNNGNFLKNRSNYENVCVRW